MTAPPFTRRLPWLAGARLRGAGWLVLSAPFWRFFASVAFVNEMYYACQEDETQVKTALNWSIRSL
jgi:hypothetical protein